MQKLVATLSLPTATTHQLDGTVKQVKNQEVSNKSFTDKAYGSIGEQTSLVPIVKNVSVDGISTADVTAVETAKADPVATPDISIASVTVVQFDATNFKGVK